MTESTEPDLVARYLYIVRHGEALPDESGLSDSGQLQATLLGRRLRGKPITIAHHSPLPRAAQTARLIAEQVGGDSLSLQPSDVAGDYIPYVPERDELPPEFADRALRFVSSHSSEEREHGAALALRALDLFTGPVPEPIERHELLVTHNYLVGWLVRHALGAPPWRWLGVNQANAGLTVIRYAPDLPPSILVFNDVSHLPAELQWTGFPLALRV